LANPGDPEAAMALERAVGDGAQPSYVASVFADAAARIVPNNFEARETRKELLFRAARIFDHSGEREHAETIYQQILEVDPNDEIATVALEEVRKGLGKYDEIVEMLLTRSEGAAPGEDKARIMSEIGRLYTSELDDK